MTAIRNMRRPTRYYSPYHYSDALRAAIRLLNESHPKDPFPVREEVVTSMLATVVTICDAAIVDTAPWGTPETMEASTWACVAWNHREHAEAVRALAVEPVLNRKKLQDAIALWLKR